MLTDDLLLLRDLGYTHLDMQAAARRAPAQEVADRGSQAAEGQQIRDTPADAVKEAPLAVDGPDTDQITGSRTLDDLAAIASPCVRCRLAGTRSQVVFGSGNPNADLMFIGEAPGRDEDLQGKPFVGRAGQLLTDIIKAMKLTRDDVYISNVIKCRPPENRNPEPDELDACRPYIRRQIEFIKPKVIVTLGKFALQSLSGKTYSITAARGSWTDFEGIRVMPTYHPAYLLRNPAAKKDVWADMKKVMAELGISV